MVSLQTGQLKFLLSSIKSLHPPRHRLSSRLPVGIRQLSFDYRFRLISGENEGRQKGPENLKTSQKFLFPFLTGLLVFGLGLTAYGLYGLHDTMTMWPPELRKDLRKGLLAKRKGDLETAVSCLSRVWEQAKSMPLASFGEEPRLKTSGLAIILSGVLEDSHEMERAYRIYKEGFMQMFNGPTTVEESLNTDSLKLLNVAERIRAVSIAYKLGKLSQELQKSLAEEEKWLVWSVEALLKTVLQGSPASSKITGSISNMSDLVGELELPSWAMLHDFAAPFDALGGFYARTGNISYALPLYLQAISILIPPGPRKSSADDRCRGAQLMGNIADLMLRSHPSDDVPTDILAQAEAWAKKGLEVIQVARKESSSQHQTCEQAYVVMLYNFAMIRKFAGDVEDARNLFQQSLTQAKVVDMQEGTSIAQAALKSLDLPS